MNKDFAADNAELLRRAADGDEDARSKLVTQNMGLVHSVVRRFLNRGHEAEDLFQIGCIGLIRAAERFDAGFGVQFSTYAVPMIIGEIKRFIRDDGIIKVSRSLKDTAVRAMRVKESMIRATGREPSVAEIADEMGMSSAELAAALEAQVKPESLYMTADDGNSESRQLIDRIESRTDEVGDMLNRLLVQQTVEELDDRDKTIVYLRYFRQKTQAQVAAKLGISQVQVSRLEKKILLKMREKIAGE